MAFDIRGLDPTGAGRKGAPKFPTYVSSVDALSTILADGYFDTYQTSLETNDLMYLVGTDGEVFATVVSASKDVALTPVMTVASSNAKTSADAALAFGYNLLNSTLDQAYTLPTPIAGMEVEATLTTASTGTTIIANSTGVTIGAAGATLTMVAGDTVKLRATSATRWEIVGGRGEAVLS